MKIIGATRFKEQCLGLLAGRRLLHGRGASTRLDFDGDPADELIAATSLVHNVPLLTRDRTIGRSRQVPLA